MTASSVARYRVTHRTEYRYSDTVAICQNQLRMMPRRFAHVRCISVNTDIQPPPDVVDEHEDYFGNHVHSFAIESLHRQLTVVVRSEVEISHAPWMDSKQSPPWEHISLAVRTATDPRWYRVGEFAYDSPLIKRGEIFADFALPSFPAGRPIVEAVLDLTKRIHREFRYDVTATTVDTPTMEAFHKRSGVCQDFSHIQIACLRSIGLPARYVSGYLRTIPPPGKKRMVGADESHAWISVYAGTELGWVDFDPTNACITGTDHIPICIGRDYQEVSPMRGVVMGGGQTQLSVSVDVEPIETPAP